MPHRDLKLRTVTMYLTRVFRDTLLEVFVHFVWDKTLFIHFPTPNLWKAWLNSVTSVWFHKHYDDVIMSAMASQITGVSIVYSSVCSGADQRKYQRSVFLTFVSGIHRWPEKNSPHKGPVTRKMFPFDDVITSAIEGTLANTGTILL